MKRLLIIRMVLVTVLIAAMAAGSNAYIDHREYKAMHTMPPGLKAFDVHASIPECGRWKEHMPKMRNPAAYRLYIEARKLWRSKPELEMTQEEGIRILTDVQKAAEMGDWGARALLAYFYRHDLGAKESNMVLKADGYKYVEILKSAVAAGQPWGYYDLGVVYEYGFGGIPLDRRIAWAHYLRAAELGSPEAQVALADAYMRAGRPDAKQAMLQCAYRQGHGPAAYSLGIDAEIKKQHLDAIHFYQDAVKYGSQECAALLSRFFETGAWDIAKPEVIREIHELGISADDERVRRYQAIDDALLINPDLRFKRLDQVLPLPPAKLPKWKGIEDAMEPETDEAPTY